MVTIVVSLCAMLVRSLENIMIPHFDQVRRGYLGPKKGSGSNSQHSRIIARSFGDRSKGRRGGLVNGGKTQTKVEVKKCPKRGRRKKGRRGRMTILDGV